MNKLSDSCKVKGQTNVDHIKWACEICMLTPCWSDGYAGVMSVTSGSSLLTTCIAWEIISTTLEIGGTSNGFEDSISHGLCFSTYFLVTRFGIKTGFLPRSIFSTT